MKNYLYKQRIKADEYRKRYEDAEVIPVTVENYRLILLLVYKERIWSVIVIKALLLVILFCSIAMYGITNQVFVFLYTPVFVIGMTLIFPLFWIPTIFYLSKSNKKSALRKIDWLSEFHID